MEPSSSNECIQTEPKSQIKELEFSHTVGQGINALEITIEGKMKTFGQLDKETFKIGFREEAPLIGLYGYEDNGLINQIGFYTMIAQCSGIV